MSVHIRGSELLVRIAAPAVVAVSLVFAGDAQVGNATTYAAPIRMQVDGEALQRSGTAQTHELTGSNATQSAQGDAGAVSQIQLLTGGNTTIAAASSSGGISQVQTLAGDNAAQTDLSDSGSIVQSHVIAGDNTTTTTTTSSGSIVQSQLLDSTNAIQTPSSTGGDITQTQTLTGDATVQVALGSSGEISFPVQFVAYRFTAGKAVRVTQLNSAAVPVGFALATAVKPITTVKTGAHYVN